MRDTERFRIFHHAWAVELSADELPPLLGPLYADCLPDAEVRPGSRAGPQSRGILNQGERAHRENGLKDGEWAQGRRANPGKKAWSHESPLPAQTAEWRVHKINAAISVCRVPPDSKP